MVFFLSPTNTDRRPAPRNDLLDEIPPDPVNFLREDGDDAPRQESSQSQRAPVNRNRNNRNRPDRPRPDRSNNEGDDVTGDSPPRPRNQNQRPRPPQQQNRSPQEGSAPRKPPQQLRNERRSVPQNCDQTSPPDHSQPNRHRRQNNRQPTNKEGGDRNNITVQITDGEVRSVKCKSWSIHHRQNNCVMFDHPLNFSEVN